MRDIPDENDTLNRSDNYGTLTLRRKREEKERDAKMEQLRKKLKTDDESKLEIIKLSPHSNDVCVWRRRLMYLFGFRSELG